MRNTTEAPTRFLRYRTRTALRLPFEGEWSVVWGGRSLKDNHHAFTRDQRFAYDFAILVAGRTFVADGLSNSDYHSWGQRILAPAEGRIVAIDRYVSDNKPGRMNAENPLGNHVIIDHGNSEFSFLAHLRHGTVQVKVGQIVEGGALLGLCGNSGHSSEPHLHFHLQTTPRFADGEGLPAQFLDYCADNRLVRRGEPKRWQRVTQQGAAPSNKLA